MASLCSTSDLHTRHAFDIHHSSRCCILAQARRPRTQQLRDAARCRLIARSIASQAGNLDDSCWPEPTSTEQADLDRLKSGAAASTSPQCEAEAQQPAAAAAAAAAGAAAAVPWGVGKTVQVVALWLLAYFATGQLLVPFVLSLCGIERGDLSFPDKAILHLLLDLWELAVTVVVLWRCLAKYKPREKGFFPLRWEGARWVPWLLAGMLSFPVVDWLAHESLIWVNGPDGYAELGYAELEATLHSGDWGTVMAYLVVVAACAPAWEELIFRGFLLASLSKYLPGGWAVVSNSLLFALCHFRLETLAPLFVLGLVFGGVYVRTNNLVPSILLHSLWNVYVVATMVLRSYGWKWWWVPSAFC